MRASFKNDWKDELGYIGVHLLPYLGVVQSPDGWLIAFGWLIWGGSVSFKQKKPMNNYNAMEPGQRRENPMRSVYHQDLEPIGDSRHARQCPACETGILTMRRNEHLCLLNTDACLFCGQRYIFIDIADGAHVELKYLEKVKGAEV